MRFFGCLKAESVLEERRFQRAQIVAVSRTPQVRMPKIIALPEQRLALVAGQGVAEAVAEVEVGGVAALMACPLASQDM
jgi:hypothetical protein